MSKSQEKIAAFAFGVVFVIVLIVLAISFPNPTPFQYTTFRIILALAAGGVAVMIPGFLNFKVATWLRAGGALAVFAIVYFKSPAQLTGVNVSDASAPRQISIALHRPGADAECPRLPASAQIKITRVQDGSAFPPLNIVAGCKATLAVSASTTGLAKLALTGASPYELLKPDATYQLDTTSWEPSVTDTPRMHLLVTLFSYTGQCENLQRVFDTFQTILRSKAQSLRSLFATTDHRYDYLSSVNVIPTGQTLNMSPAEIRTYWQDNGALEILSGLCIGRPDGDVMRSSIFSGPLSGSLPEPLVADLKISETEFATTRDIYTAAMLYALAREAQSRELEQDIVISYLSRAHDVAFQIKGDTGKALVVAIEASLTIAGAPTNLSQ
jgi:hypothetical protein